MAKTSQVRGVPDEIHAELRARAAAIGLSLSDYLLREVARIASRPPLADLLEWVDERGWGVPAGTAVATLRELRDDSSAA